MKKVEKNIQSLAKKCDRVFIWTDYDREGEHIGFEILEIISKVRPLEPNYISSQKHTAPIKVERAKFTSVTRDAMRYAFEHPISMNPNAAIAVETRREIDLRVGYSATRAQTLRFQELEAEKKRTTLSFGPCQCPTLSFVVSREQKMHPSDPESLVGYNISIDIPQVNLTFHWNMKTIYSLPTFKTIFTSLFSHNIIRGFCIEKAVSKRKTIPPPNPLNTIKLLKDCCSIYKIKAKEISKAADNLYRSQMLSYPRTETNTWLGCEDMRDTALAKLISSRDHMPDTLKAAIDSFLRIHNGTIPANTRTNDGRENDHSHPPLHPTGEFMASALTNNARQVVYNHVVVHFLASMCPEARLLTSEVNGHLAFVFDNSNNNMSSLSTINSFRAKSKSVVSPGYAQIFWDSHVPSKSNIEDSATRSNTIHNIFTTQLPTTYSSFTVNVYKTNYKTAVTESSLVGFMSTHAIGTDASIPTIIQTLEQREYIRISRGSIASTDRGSKLNAFHRSLESTKLEGTQGEYTYPPKRALVELKMRMIANDNSSIYRDRDFNSSCFGFNFKCNNIDINNYVRTIIEEASGEAESIIDATRLKQENTTNNNTSNKQVFCGSCGSAAHIFVNTRARTCNFRCSSCHRFMSLHVPESIRDITIDTECPQCRFTRVVFMLQDGTRRVECFGCRRLGRT